MMKKTIVAICLACSSLYASASVLTGDTVALTTSPPVFSTQFMVQAGDDLTVPSGAGTFVFNLDGGTNGNRFTLISNGASTFSGASSFTLGDLDFSDDAILTGFNLAATSLSNFSFTTTIDSITFSFSDTFAADGVVIDGTFATSSAVPLPGTLPLLLLGFGVFGVSKRTRRALRH